MKNSFILRTFLSLAMLLSGASAITAKADDKPFVPPSLVKTETDIMLQFGKKFGEYFAADCDSLINEARPDGQRLKKCLTITRDLRDRFGAFSQAVNSLPGKVKNAGKWTKELDEDFAQNAVKRGVNSAIVDEANRNGGVRVFYEKNLGALNRLKSEMEAEIKTMESLQSKAVSDRNSFGESLFVKAASRRRAAAFLSCKNLAVKYVAYVVGMGVFGTGGSGLSASGAGPLICAWLDT